MPLQWRWLGGFLLQGFSRLIPGNTVVKVVDSADDFDMEYQHDEHRVHLIVYHLVWCPKRRKPVLVGAVANDCRALIEAKCAEHAWHIEELAIQPDHVHLLVRGWPTVSAADVLKDVKGVTSHELRSKYPQLRRLPSLWTRSYFASTAGDVSSETIRRYIEGQKGM
jgi:putative transposase